METLATLLAVATYLGLVWYLWRDDIRSWLAWMMNRIRERADETRTLNRMWEIGGQNG